MKLDAEDRELLARVGVVATSITLAVLSSALVLGSAWRLFTVAAGI